MKLLPLLIMIECMFSNNLVHAMDNQHAAIAQQNICCSCQQEKTHTLKHCGTCKIATYCDQQCQKNDWPKHKKLCRHLASITSTTEQTLDALANFSADDVWQQSFEIYAQAQHELKGLLLTGLEEDGYFDRLATTRAIAPAQLQATLDYLKERGLGEVKTIFMPGIGYLSPLELKAFNTSFHHPTIMGFDRDAMMVKATQKANPSLAHTLRVADGRNPDAWQANPAPDLIVIMHPTPDKHPLMTTAPISWPMLELCAQFFPDTPIIVMSKSLSEHDGVYGEMMKLSLQTIEKIDNTKRSFPCMSCADKLKFPINTFTTKPVKMTDNIVADLVTIKNNNPEDVEKYLIRDGERRYHFIVQAKTPKH